MWNFKWVLPWAKEDVKLRGGAVNCLPEISNRVGEQAEKLPEFPIVLSENLPK